MTEFTINLESDSKVALYEQIYRHIVAEIRSGRLREGERLPSKRRLCAHLGVSRSTVETAYAILAAEGYIRTEPRSGVFVCPITPLHELSHQPQKNAPGTSATERVKRDIRYRFIFSTGAVDTSVFPYSTWAKLNKETVERNPELLQRGDRQGDAPLRRTLCEFLHQYRGVSCDPEQLVIGAGMEYLLDVLLKLFERDQIFALEDPGYRAVYRTIANNNGLFTPIAVDAEGMSLEGLYASHASIAYVTPSHQFPMGVTMPAGRRTQLLKWAGEAPDRYIIEDDYDSEFRYASRPIPAMQGLDEAGRVVYVSTFSRSIAPSIRVAYLALPEPLLKRYHERFDYAASTVSRFEQQTLCRFIESGAYARHLRRVANLYKERRTLLMELLGAIPGAVIRGHEAGLHFLLTVPHLSEAELVRRAAEASVRVHGLSEYAHTHPIPASTLVLGYAGMSEEQMREAVGILVNVWN